jgi:predicted dehydrogenase
VSAAVVVGSGSAGRRHAAALLARAPGRRVVMVRRPGSTTPLEPLDALGVELVPGLQDALRTAPALAVVASPAPWHATAATELLDAGCHVLVEKPVVASLDAPTTQSLAVHPHVRRRLLVGYHLRFTDLLAQVVSWIGQGRIGTPTAGELVVGQHLGSWRPGTEAHHGVSARAELGGGVLLELSHELDVARVLFDAPVATVEHCELRHDGAPTDGTVETVADLELRMGSGPSCRIHLDMTSHTPVRRWTIGGTEGTVVADVLASRVSLRRSDGSVDERSIAAGDRERAESRMIAHLEDMAANGAPPRCGIDDGLAAVAVVEAAKRSAAQGGPVEVTHLDRSAA